MISGPEQRVRNSFFAIVILFMICGGAVAFTILRTPQAPARIASNTLSAKPTVLTATNGAAHTVPPV